MKAKIDGVRVLLRLCVVAVMAVVDFYVYAASLLGGDNAPNPSVAFTVVRFFDSKFVVSIYIAICIVLGVIWAICRPAKRLTFWDALLFGPPIVVFLVICAAVVDW